MNYSKILSLINGASRTVDFSLASNVLELSNIQMDGSVSGHVVISASATTTTYSIIWPAAQAASSGYVLTNDGTGVLSWAAPASSGVTSISIASSNGFAGSSSGGSTPILTLSTGVTGILYGNGTSVAAAIASNFPTLNQDTTGNAATATTATNIAGGANGSVPYQTASATTTMLAIGSTGQVLTVVSGVPAWAAPATSGTVTSVDASVPSFLSISGNPITTSGTLAIGYSGTALPIANGGTGVTAVPTSPATSAFAAWDANKNLSANSFIEGYATTATAAGTTTLVVGSAEQQYFTGTTTQTVVLPVTSTLILGQSFTIVNNSTGVVTVQSSGANTVQTMAAGTELVVTVISTSLTTAAAWNASYGFSSAGSFANTALSNLTTTSINQDLIPGINNSQHIGSASFAWLTVFASAVTSGSASVGVSNQTLKNNSGTVTLNWASGLLSDSSSDQSLDWLNRRLYANDGTTIMATWSSTAGIAFNYVTASTVPVFNASKQLVSSSVTSTTLGFLDATSSIQTQLNSKITNPMTTAGDIIYENAISAPARLGIGSTGQVLTVVSGLPAWATPATSGTVSSVAFADDSSTPIYSVSGSPVTSSGTLAITLATQSANTVFAGPTTGSAAEPSFRSLVAADIPSLSAVYVTQSEVGAANGVASLDSGGKVPVSQLPNGVFVYQGLYDPSTNTPALADGTGTAGQVYYVSTAFNGIVAGAFGGASLNFSVGDLAIYNGTAWELTTPAAGVSSVNGTYGAVILSMISANGFAGIYSGTALTVSTTVTGILQGNGTAISAASTTGSGSVVLSASPTFTGTISAVNETISGNLVAPIIQFSAVYGGVATLSANTTYAMRYGIPANGETVGQLYVADWDTSSFDLFWCVGLFNSASSTATGVTISITNKGSFTLGSSDINFSSSDQGKPTWLGASGAYTANSAFSPSAGDANEKLGIVTGASTIWVDCQMMGVS